MFAFYLIFLMFVAYGYHPQSSTLGFSVAARGKVIEECLILEVSRGRLE